MSVCWYVCVRKTRKKLFTNRSIFLLLRKQQFQNILNSKESITTHSQPTKQSRASTGFINLAVCSEQIQMVSTDLTLILGGWKREVPEASFIVTLSLFCGQVESFYANRSIRRLKRKEIWSWNAGGRHLGLARIGGMMDRKTSRRHWFVSFTRHCQPCRKKSIIWWKWKEWKNVPCKSTFKSNASPIRNPF